MYEAIGQGYEEFMQTFDTATSVERSVAELSARLAAITQQLEDPRVRAPRRCTVCHTHGRSCFGLRLGVGRIRTQTGVYAALIAPASELERIKQQAIITDELIQVVTVLGEVISSRTRDTLCQ